MRKRVAFPWGQLLVQNECLEEDHSQKLDPKKIKFLLGNSLLEAMALSVSIRSEKVSTN